MIFDASIHGKIWIISSLLRFMNDRSACRLRVPFSPFRCQRTTLSTSFRVTCPRAPAPSFTWNTSTTRAALADSSSRLVYLVYATAFAPRPGSSNFQECASSPGYLKSSTRDAFDFIESLVKDRCETLRKFSISASL